jgi:hypothetical protein
MTLHVGDKPARRVTLLAVGTLRVAVEKPLDLRSVRTCFAQRIGQANIQTIGRGGRNRRPK